MAKWIDQILCRHEWKYLVSEVDYEAKEKYCWKCGKRVCLRGLFDDT